MTDKQIYQIGLTMINGVGDILARHLLEAVSYTHLTLPTN